MTLVLLQMGFHHFYVRAALSGHIIVDAIAAITRSTARRTSDRGATEALDLQQEEL